MKINCMVVILASIVFITGCGSKNIYPLVSVTEYSRLSAPVVINQVSLDRLRSLVWGMFNTSRYFEDERVQTLNSIEAEVKDLGYQVEIQRSDLYDYPVRNLVLTKYGSTHPDNWVVIMAHYDTVYGVPGADDNGSGCAALLEIAKHLSGIDFENTIKLVFTDKEESGLLGSRCFVSRIPSDKTILAAVSLEMIGYTSARQQNPFPAPFEVDKGDFLAVVGAGDSFAMANDFVRNLKQNSVFIPTIIICPGDFAYNPIFEPLTRSDHAAFWIFGLPAIMITDSADFRNPNYHCASDSISTLDFTFLKKTTQAVLTSVYLWAKPLS